MDFHLELNTYLHSFICSFMQYLMKPEVYKLQFLPNFEILFPVQLSPPIIQEVVEKSFRLLKKSSGPHVKLKLWMIVYCQTK